MNATTNPAEKARATYRTLRAQSKLSPREFDLKAEHFAHEDADGEEVTPDNWLRAASTVLFDRGEWKGWP